MADGEITLAVTLTPKDIKAKSVEIRNQVQQIFNGVTAGNLDKNLQKVYVQMDKLVSKSDSLVAKMNEMENTRVDNPAIAKLIAEANELEKKYNALYDATRKIGENGEIFHTQEDQVKLDTLESRLNEIYNELESISQTGATVPLSEADPARYKALAVALNQCNNELTVAMARTQQVNTNFSKVYHIVRSVVSAVQTSFRTITSELRKLGSHVKSAFNTALKSAQKFASYVKGALVNALRRTTKESNNAFSPKNLKRGLTMILKYGFGVRSIYFAFRKLRTAVKEGLQNLVQYEKAVGTSQELDSTNQRITSLNTSLLYLKNAWASAFAPVINVVVPILNSLIDKLAVVGNTIARFIGSLTGQSTVLNAVKVDAQDYADSLDKTGSSAGGAADKVKKLTDRLASFDDLNVLGKDNDDDASGGGGGGLDDYAPDPSEMFEYVDAINEFGQKLKDAWNNQDWKGIGKLIAKKLDDSIIKPIIKTLSWDNCKDTVMDFINQWGSVINGFLETTELFDDIGIAIGKGITTIANTITQALGKLSLRTLGDDIFRVFKNAVDNVDETAIADAISAVFLSPIRIADGFFDGGKDSEEVSKLFTDIGTKIANTVNGINWYGIFTGIFDFASSIGSALVDTITGFVNGGGFSGMLTQIAKAINDSVDKLTPEDFEEFGKALGSLIVSVLSDLNKFMDDTSESFDAVIEGIGDALAGLPWEDIFQNAGEIAVKIINAIIKVLNIVGQHMNEVQDNGKTLAQNLGETIGDCISQIDFESMGETFGLIAEGIVDGIISALQNSDEGGLAGIIKKFFDGFKDADADTFEFIAGLAVWGTIAKAILAGITRALPTIIAQGGSSGLFSAIGSGLSGIGNKAEAAGIGGWGASQTASSSGSFVAGGVADMGALAVAAGGVIVTLQGVADAWRLMNGEIDETDFGGINTEIVSSENEFENFGNGIKNAFSSFDQFRLTFAMGIEGIGEGFAWLGENTVKGWDEVKNKAPEVWSEISTTISTKFGEAKDWLDEKSGEIKDNLTTSWQNITTEAETHWNTIKDNVTTKFTEAKDFVEENVSLFKDNISAKWDEMKGNAYEKWVGIKGNVTEKAGELKSEVEEKVETFKTNLAEKWQSIKGTAYEKFVGMKTNIIEVFEQLKEAVKNPINGFLGIIESMVNRVIEGINLIADTFNTLPDVTLTNPFTGTEYSLGFRIPHLSYVSIPRLAEGAVIPPNKEFMAVLGDQSNGTNIEAPLDTIKQAVAEELSAQIDVLTNGFEAVVQAINNKDLVIGDKDIGKANARYSNQQRIIRGTSF